MKSSATEDAFWAIALKERSQKEVALHERSELAPDMEEALYRQLAKKALRRKEIIKIANEAEFILFPTVASDDGLFGSTGGELWFASKILATYLFNEKAIFPDFKIIIELGSGLGLAGLAAARIWPQAKVLLTDADQAVVHNLQSTIQFNSLKQNTEAIFFDFTQKEDDSEILSGAAASLVLAAAIVYTPHLARGLAQYIYRNAPYRTLVLQRYDRPGFLSTFIPTLLKYSSSLSFRMHKVICLSVSQQSQQTTIPFHLEEWDPDDRFQFHCSRDDDKLVDDSYFVLCDIRRL